MFDEEDIKRTSEFLPRLSRIIMFAAGITNDGYTTRYHKYFKSMFPTKSRKEFTQQSAADRKSLLDREKLTFSRMRIILSAMGYDIEAVSIRIVDRVTGEVKTFSTDNTVEQLKEMLEQEKEIGIKSL